MTEKNYRTTTGKVLSDTDIEQSPPELDEILKKASAFRPPTRDLVWRQIPWHTDASAAIKQARDEKRPLFVWLAGGRDRDGTPLERC